MAQPERFMRGQSAGGCACGDGPVFEVRLGADGQPLAFADAYPNALPILKRLARGRVPNKLVLPLSADHPTRHV